jgi:predicted TPR repeat methyltransferase
VPERASDAYVASTFDDFAHSFDNQLAGLQYRAPALVGDAVRALLGEPKADLEILDAGCGTGLCAPILAPFARRLVGVDLSGGMLAKAQARGGYQDLHKAELTAFMQAHVQRFDLIVSADTLCYFGDLIAVSRVALDTLKPGGWLVFTVEALAEPQSSAGPGFKLTPFGRYGHTREHVQHALAAAGFEGIALEEAVLRKEAAEPVRGYVVCARRPPRG